MHARWESVLTSLWETSRFTSYFYQTVQFVATEAVPTLALSVSGMRPVLYYHPTFPDHTPPAALTALLVHELLHVVNGHDHRALKDHEPYLQNLAQDMVINSWMREKKEHFFSASRTGETTPLLLPESLPGIPEDFYSETGITDPSWEDLYQWFGRRGPKAVREFTDAVREMFRDLKKNLSKTQSAANPDDPIVPLAEEGEDSPAEETIPDGLTMVDQNGDALPTGTHLFLDVMERRQLQSQVRKVMEMAASDPFSKSDRVYEAVTRMIRSVRKFRNPSWERRIKSIVDRTAHSNEWRYATNRFNRRYFAQGVYAAGRALKEKQLLTVCVDVSASMTSTPHEIATAFGVLESFLNRFSVHLLCVDEALFVPRIRNAASGNTTDLAKPCLYRKGDWKLLETGNSGTTFFAPLFNGYLTGHRELVVVITDGYVHDLGKLKPYHPTLWLISASRTEPFYPPFGEVVQLPGEQERGRV